MSRFVIPEKPEALESGGSGDFLTVSNKSDVSELSEREVDRMTEGEGGSSSGGPRCSYLAREFAALRGELGPLLPNFGYLIAR